MMPNRSQKLQIPRVTWRSFAIRLPLTARFALITLMPVVFLALGAFVGGAPLVTALLYTSVFSTLLDQILRTSGSPNFNTAQKDKWANALCVTLALAHFVLLVTAIAAVSGLTGLAVWERIIAFFAFGLFFGQVSNSNAHELIHRPQRFLRLLGRWVYISLLFGHHTSAHPKVHHRYVATPEDPNSARLGESLYSFMPRAWIGSFRAGAKAETEMLLRAKRPMWHHPYIQYILGSAALLGLSATFAGLPGLAVHIGLASYTIVQLLMSDYVQHYGLTRNRRPDGRYEPVGDAHSWNAPHVFSSLIMLHAPRHSDHHAHPATPYPALTLPSGSPMLPAPLPRMALLALAPRAWRRVMDPRVARIKAAAKA